MESVVTDEITSTPKTRLKVGAAGRSAFQKANDRRTICELHLRGKSEWAIMEALNARPDVGYLVTRATVHKDLVRVREEMIVEMRASREQWIATELSGLTRQENELWAEWERSKQAAEIQRQKGVASTATDGSSKITPKELTKTREEQCGDPRYHALILQIRERRAKLLGLDEPEKYLIGTQSVIIVHHAHEQLAQQDQNGNGEKLLTEGNGDSLAATAPSAN